MKKILQVLIIFLFSPQVNYSQTTQITTKPIAEIFTDFHYNFNDTAKNTGFGVNRAFLGINYQPEGSFSSTIIINVGSPEELVFGAKPRRYAYFREASIKYSNKNLSVAFGIASTRIFEFQQKFWGKRYIANEYQSANGYGSVADLGVVADYKINEIFKIDFAVLNGAGYSNLQIDSHLKTTFGITITPAKGFAVRLYSDIMKPLDVLQCTFIGFAGYKNDLITIGAEASYKSNLDIIEGHDGWGVSGTGAISISKKAEIFIRYDYSSSVVPKGDIIQWNYQKDGSFVIYGVQYIFSQNVKMALNYQGTYPFNPFKQATDAVFLNALFKF